MSISRRDFMKANAAAAAAVAAGISIPIKNVAAEEKGFAKINFEQFYKWNPDILFLSGPGHIKLKTKDIIENKVDKVDFSPLSAVKSGKVYNTNLGMWNWFTPNPDGPLVLAWIAKSTYPEESIDYDIKAMIKDYYKTWYRYELNDEQVEDMFDT